MCIHFDRPAGNSICFVYCICGYKTPIFYWTLVSGDTWPVGKRDSQRVALLASKTGGAVVLAHDFDRKDDDVGDMVLDSLRSTLSMARETGMKTLTMSELMGRDWEV